MPPAPPGMPQILPRQPGESAYSYRNRRSIALTGQTLYERRKASGLSRGLTTSEARGHAPAPNGQTEYQRRRARTMERYGLTPSQLRYQQLDTWLAINGFSPATTGFSQTQLRQLAPRLKWMNENSAPGGEIYPALLYEARQMEFEDDVEPEWTYNRIMQRYDAMYEFKVMHNRELGNFFWFRERIPDMSTVWWYYH